MLLTRVDGVPHKAVEGHGEEVEQRDGRHAPSEEVEHREHGGYALHEHESS